MLNKGVNALARAHSTLRESACNWTKAVVNVYAFTTHPGYQSPDMITRIASLAIF